MITYIICSVDPEKAYRLRENIIHGSGLDSEFIIVDNRQNGHGICSVYNTAAKNASSDFLCFLHEDVLFRGKDWAKVIVSQLSKNDCGVIGFMGSVYKSKSPSGWNCISRLNRSHFIQTTKEGSRESDSCSQLFEPSLVLDGACLFVRKDVWEICKFDSETISGFHCYDIDFCLTVFKSGYKNYVCSSVWLEHFSAGFFSEAWLDSTMKTHEKWRKDLPMCVKDAVNYSFYYKNYIELRAFYVFLKSCIRLVNTRKYKDAFWSMLPQGWLHPISWMKCCLMLVKM